MTTMSTGADRARQPKGIPVGGQFAASAHTESGVSLTLDEQDDLAAENAATIAAHVDNEARLDRNEAMYEAEMAFHQRERDKARWGDVSNVREGSRTPWGAADGVDHPAAGIVVVHTPGHGGIKLSPQRNAEIPPALRSKSGWYEEDCESNIVGMHHPEAFPHYKDGDHDAIKDACEQSVKAWFPDEYTKATGNPVSVEESSVLRDRQKQADKEAFRAEHSDQFVTLGSGDTHASWIPDGYAACKARLDDTGEERTYLMPRAAVITDGSYGRHALVDPSQHLDVTDVVNAQPDRPWTYRQDTVAPIKGDALVADLAGLTSAQADRAYSELHKRWRFQNDDGTTTVESLGEHMARVGVVGKHPSMDGDKVVYSVSYDGSRSTRVSKATYDALRTVPDTSDETQKSYIAKERARVRFERAKTSGLRWNDPAKFAKTEDAYRDAAASHRTLSDAKSEQAKAWQSERDQMQVDAFARLAAESGRTFD